MITTRITTILVAALLVFLIDFPLEWTARAQAASSTHRVSGKVLAISTAERPQTIVISSKAGKDELIVGATVGDRVTIRRGKKSIPLDQLRIGETVQLTYQKTRAGLVASTIAAK